MEERKEKIKSKELPQTRPIPFRFNSDSFVFFFLLVLLLRVLKGWIYDFIIYWMLSSRLCAPSNKNIISNIIEHLVILCTFLIVKMISATNWFNIQPVVCNKIKRNKSNKKEWINRNSTGDFEESKFPYSIVAHWKFLVLRCFGFFMRRFLFYVITDRTDNVDPYIAYTYFVNLLLDFPVSIVAVQQHTHMLCAAIEWNLC